ncbi:hypothetical protein HJFPF1_09354 [Paramyrothecium foliicola]|nr:hypothetical protein HJFPF1_09354 [Paramyrothecium foliicola]
MGDTPPYPPKPPRLLTWAIWFWVLMIVLDISQMIVNIMAYTGAQSEEDRQVIKDTHITFPPAGHHVQRTMIALPSLGLIMHWVLPTLVSIWLARHMRDFTERTTKVTRRKILMVPIAYHVVCTAVWAVLIAFQSDYVPILGTDKLPECVEYGNELTQCPMLTACWVLAMVVCLTHLILAFILLLMVMHMSYFQPESVALNPTPTQRVSSPPPASVQTRRSGPVPYYAVIPSGDSVQDTPRPSYHASCRDPAPPPYSENKVV